VWNFWEFVDSNVGSLVLYPKKISWVGLLHKERLWKRLDVRAGILMLVSFLASGFGFGSKVTSQVEFGNDIISEGFLHHCTPFDTTCFRYF